MVSTEAALVIAGILRIKFQGEKELQGILGQVETAGKPDDHYLHFLRNGLKKLGKQNELSRTALQSVGGKETLDM